jgi:magnesium transporter
VPIVLVDEQHCDETPASGEDLHQKIAAGEFIWVDVNEPTEEDCEALVSGLGIAADTSTEALRMHQRPRIVDLQDGLAMLVVYALAKKRGDDPVEVHMLVTEKFVVTIHDSAVSALETIQEHNRNLNHKDPTTSSMVVVHQVIDSITDGYFPRLSELDDDIDDVEEDIFKSPTDEQLQRLFQMKRELVSMRRVVSPMRDMLGAVFTGVVELPGFNDQTSGWLRDAYDHTIRISDLIDSYRDLLSGAMDVYLSTVSNRLNTVMKQLTVIATIFLPLSFITGFFGQNFSFLVGHIGSAWTFWVFAIGVEMAVVLGMLWMFRKRKWI